jgi:plasmid stabilization system protein ParE
MPPVDFHPRALAEARAERRYYARISPALAGRFMAELDAVVARVGAAPQAWPPHLHGTRFCRFNRFPFLLIYLEDAAGVLVIAVAHTGRKPGYWRRRLP